MMLSIDSQKQRIDSACNNAGKRYNRVINLEIKSLKTRLHATNRDPEFLEALLRLAYKIKHELNYFRNPDEERLEEAERLRKDSIAVANRLLSLRSKTKNQNIRWSVLRRKLNGAVALARDLWLSESEGRENKEINNISRLHRALNNLSQFINSDVDIELFSTPRLLIRGDAGIGKTHLLCDYATSRIAAGKPTLLFLSHELISQKDSNPISRLAALLGYQNRQLFLEDLKNLANSSPDRVCLIIDAINEASDIEWLQLSELFKIQGLSIVISMRTGYDHLLPNSGKYTRVEHFGFSEMKWDAASTFLKHYGMNLPEIPVMNSEFTNPLFLTMFCEAYAGKNVKTFKGKGATHLFEYYIVAQSKKVFQELGVSLDKKYLWNGLIKEIGKWMGINGDSAIPHNQLRSLIEEDQHLSSYVSQLIGLMEHHGILLKYMQHRKRSYYYTFTYNRFSDHLIVRYLLTENRINSKGSAKKFFADETFLIDNIHNTGLLEALSIQIPERCKKTEFVWVIPEKYRSHYTIQSAFLNGIKWRDVDVDGIKGGEALYIDESQIKEYINTYLSKDTDRVINCLFEVATSPNHPLNARKLDLILRRQSMAERDSWFQSYLLEHNKQEGSPLSRVQSWSISKLPESATQSEIILLAGIVLIWTLSSTDPIIRDTSTRALIQLLRYHQNTLLQLLDMFTDIDDPYIIERLFAVAYGVVSLNPHEEHSFKLLALWFYKNHFLNKKRRPDALMDDYARGLIESYIRRYNDSLCLPLKKIAPPFSYYRPAGNIPSIETLKSKYHNEDNHDYSLIWNSLMYDEGGAALADFGNYTLHGALSGFSNIPLSKSSKRWSHPIDCFEKYNMNTARRWIMNRVIELGWNPRLHNQYDRLRGSFDRIQNTTAERIGKKYQRIALYELTAVLGSNYYYIQDCWPGESLEFFKGAYQTLLRDIDPTIDPLLISEIKLKQHTKEKPTHWWLPTYTAWDAKNWQFSSEDIPTPRTIIESHQNGDAFLTLLTWAIWKSEREVPEDEDDRRYSELWMRAQGYIVSKKDLANIIDWCGNKRFYNDTLPQPTEYNGKVFLAEFPDSSAYREVCIPRERSDDWIESGNQTSFKVVQPIIQYTSSVFEEDTSLKDAPIRVYGPSPEIRALLDLANTNTIGEYKSNQENIYMLSPLVNSDLGSSALLVNKIGIAEALKKRDLTLIWSILGEKLYHNNGNYSKKRLEVQGICYLNDEGEIIENIRYEIR